MRSALVEDLQGGVLLVGGFSFQTRYLQTIYSLANAGSPSWTLMNQSLQLGRNSHVAFFADVTC
jgi:hypothetical protein